MYFGAPNKHALGATVTLAPPFLRACVRRLPVSEYVDRRWNLSFLPCRHFLWFLPKFLRKEPSKLLICLEQVAKEPPDGRRGHFCCQPAKKLPRDAKLTTISILLPTWRVKNTYQNAKLTTISILLQTCLKRGKKLPKRQFNNNFSGYNAWTSADWFCIFDCYKQSLTRLNHPPTHPFRQGLFVRLFKVIFI